MTVSRELAFVMQGTQQVELSLPDFFIYPTVAELADHIDTCRQQASTVTTVIEVEEGSI